MSTTHPQERIGISIVAETLARLGLIWRETPMADVGVDGQIEFVTEAGEATGRLVAAQVKTGPSYLREDREGEWVFYPKITHRNYWEQFPMPVLLFLVDPDERTVYWTDARQTLRSPSQDEEKGIQVPKTAVINESSRQELFRNVGGLGQKFLPQESLVEALMDHRMVRPGFSMSFLDLFALGLTNIGNTLYFDMGLVMTVAEARSKVVNLGADEYQFVYDYMLFITAQQLADVPWADCMVDWHDRRLVPKWLARLTRRGRDVVAEVNDIERRLREAGVIKADPMIHVMQETFVEMQFTPITWERADMSANLQHVLRSAVQQGSAG